MSFIYFRIFLWVECSTDTKQCLRISIAGWSQGHLTNQVDYCLQAKDFVCLDSFSGHTHQELRPFDYLCYYHQFTLFVNHTHTQTLSDIASIKTEIFFFPWSVINSVHDGTLV